MQTITKSLLVLCVTGFDVLRLICAFINAIASLIGFLICLAIVAVLTGLVIASTVSLGPRFGVTVTVVALLIALSLVIVLVGALLLQVVRNRARRNARWSTRRERRAALVFLALFFVVALPIAGFNAIAGFIDDRTRPQYAEAALESFVVKYEPPVDQARLERTLAEFERIRIDFADQWTVPDASPRIRLYLFRDEDHYRAHTAGKRLIEWSAGYASCTVDGVVIYVPLEKADDRSPISTTPAHEMVHAIWCQKLESELFWSIPRWFHEGMAERYENERGWQYWRKAINRWEVWLNRKNLLPATQFCTYQPEGSLAEIGLFYMTSLEFIRSLESRHGIRNLNAILEDVGGGKAFEDSLSDRIGGTCDELYREWTQSFSIYS